MSSTIAARQDTSAEQNQKNHDILVAVQLFQAWLLDLRRHELASNRHPGNGIIDLAEPVARQFCIGIAEHGVFFGAQEHELRWVRGLPWLHVALRKGSKTLYLVSEETTIQGATLPYFALAFTTESSDKINYLARHRFLSMREIEMDETGAVCAVAKDIIMTLDVILIDSDESIPCLLAGRGGKSFTNRSVSVLRKPLQQ